MRIFLLMTCLEALLVGEPRSTDQVSKHAQISYNVARNVMKELEMAELVIALRGARHGGRGRPLLYWEITLKGRNMVRAWRSRT